MLPTVLDISFLQLFISFSILRPVTVAHVWSRVFSTQNNHHVEQNTVAPQKKITAPVTTAEKSAAKI